MKPILKVNVNVDTQVDIKRLCHAVSSHEKEHSIDSDYDLQQNTKNNIELNSIN